MCPDGTQAVPFNPLPSDAFARDLFPYHHYLIFPYTAPSCLVPPREQLSHTQVHTENSITQCCPEQSGPASMGPSFPLSLFPLSLSP